MKCEYFTIWLEHLIYITPVVGIDDVGKMSGENYKESLLTMK